MKEVVNTQRTEMDLREIWHSTTDRWNAFQADGYIHQNLETCKSLSSGLIRGRSANDIQYGYRKQNVGSHVIYDKESPNEVLIIRILHKRMDASSQFEEL